MKNLTTNTTTTFNMENQFGLDFYSLSATLVYILGGIFHDFNSSIVILVGLSTLTYNVLRIYNDFVKKRKAKDSPLK